MRQLVLQLLEVVQQQDTTIQQLEARGKMLEAQIAGLEARLQQRSSNSGGEVQTWYARIVHLPAQYKQRPG